MEKFLQDLLATQDLTPAQEAALQAHKEEITNYLRKEFGSDPIIKYAGSREKGTMISEYYDLDVVCYFPSSDARTLKEIRESVASHLAKEYRLHHKASAERILDLKSASTPANYHIDVVPGRFIEGSKDVFLHVAYGDKERMQTNLKTHITYIRDSGCVDIIRLIKLWACRNTIQIKSFILEIFIVRVLEGSKNKSKLKESIIEVFEAFKNNFETMKLVDPANSNNVVSTIMSDIEKATVKLFAEQMLNNIEKADTVDTWKDIFKEKAKATTSPKPIVAPLKPWGTKS